MSVTMFDFLFLITSSILLIFIETTTAQLSETSNNPPHNCSNYGLCESGNSAGKYLKCPEGLCFCLPGTTGTWCENFIDQCSSNPCASKGPNYDCVAAVGGPRCVCSSGWTGANCSTPIVNPCNPNPCLNGGVCSLKSGTYKCDCPHKSLQKPNCEQKNGCTKKPCQHGGTCIDTQNMTYRCDCLPYWHGTDCTDINVCEYANPCVHGQCVNKGSGIQVKFNCNCNPGYTGDNCTDEIDYCTVYQPCGFGSNCTPSFMNYTCNCIPGIYGRNCSLITNNCVPYTDANGRQYPNRCMTKDSKAACINSINNFTCACSLEWTERYCDMNVIVKTVMLILYGSTSGEMLPLLEELMTNPAAIIAMVPFILGTMSTSERTKLSWDYDMFYYAAYEEKSLNIPKDFLKWNDVVLGNCFTFNHLNATNTYKTRSSTSRGGLKSLFTRLGQPYGKCINEPSQVKSYYYPGRYTADGCYRSCYQDLILQHCNCMDPRYPMPSNVTACKLQDIKCVDNTSTIYGDPSTWPTCVCPLPCWNENFQINWSKGRFRQSTTNCAATPLYTSQCEKQATDSVMISVLFPELTYSLYQETPSMTFTKMIGNLGGLLGILMGIGAITFVEVAVMLFNVITTMCCYSSNR